MEKCDSPLRLSACCLNERKLPVSGSKIFSPLKVPISNCPCLFAVMHRIELLLKELVFNGVLRYCFFNLRFLSRIRSP